LRHLGLSIHNGGGSEAVGWTIRRADGTRLATDLSLAAQDVRDGEVLRLASRDEDWPEPDYDDVVLAVADGARPLGMRWHGATTRRAAVLAAVAVLLTGLPLLLVSGPPWQLPATSALAVAAVTLVAGAVLSRAGGDSGAGGIVGALALPYAFAGGLLALATNRPLADLSGVHPLLGCVALLLASVTGCYAVADRLWLFIAGAVVALHGTLGGLLSMAGVNRAGAAAVVASVAIAVMPISTVLSIRLSKLPMPDLPQTAEDLLEDRPLPTRDQVFAAVVRAEEFFSGILLGIGTTAAACVLILVFQGGIAAPLLAATVAVLLLLRARSPVRQRQRTPLLASGVFGLVVLVPGVFLSRDPSVLPLLVLAGLLPAALLALGVGLRYARRRPEPQLGRLADVAEFILGASVVPLVAAVIGLFSFVRGIGG
jgi:ESX secretion system protein EccD